MNIQQLINQAHPGPFDGDVPMPTRNTLPFVKPLYANSKQLHRIGLVTLRIYGDLGRTMDFDWNRREHTFDMLMGVAETHIANIELAASSAMMYSNTSNLPTFEAHLNQARQRLEDVIALSLKTQRETNINFVNSLTYQATMLMSASASVIAAYMIGLNMRT